jgi:hypothetical protein
MNSRQILPSNVRASIEIFSSTAGDDVVGRSLPLACSFLIRPCQIALTGRKPVDAARGSGATQAIDGKPHGRAESRPAHGAGRCCTHLPDMRFPAPSTPGRGGRFPAEIR